MSLETRVARLERLLALNKRIIGERDVGRLLQLALDTILEFTDADRGFVLLKESDGQVRVRAAANLDRQTVRSAHFRPSRSIADQVLKTGEPVLSAQAGADERFLASQSIHEMSVQSVLAIPIRSREQVVGVIYLDQRAPGRRSFDADDLRLLQDFGDMAALAVEMRRLVTTLEHRTEELYAAKQALEQTTARLALDVEAKTETIARVQQDLEARERALGLKYTFHNIVGRAPAMQRVFAVLRQVMDYPVPVLITGESGTGKELIARALHHGGPRSRHPFMAINCAAIPENLLESELFGFKKGTFTGAGNDKPGLFVAAGEGTVFLDEVGEMPLALQSKLLRVLQEREVMPVGGRASEPVKARIIAATNRDLRTEIAAGRFREDLFYRLNVVEVPLPPLRERVEDIPLLAEHFLALFCQEMGLSARRFSSEAHAALVATDWPGNVRQLENTVKSSAILSSNEVLTAEDLKLPGRREEAASPELASMPLTFTPTPDPGHIQSRADWEAHEREAILAALVSCRWNKTRAAQILGVSRRNLYRKLERYGIESPGDAEGSDETELL